MECPVPECKQRQPTELGRKLKRLRPWVQTGFLGVWLAPVGQWLMAFQAASSTATRARFPRSPARWCAGQLRRADARGPRNTLPAARHTAARRGDERVARLRVGLPIRIRAGFAGQDPRSAKCRCRPGRLHSLRRAGGVGDSSAADSWVQRHSLTATRSFPSAGCVRRARWKPACPPRPRVSWRATAGR